MPTGSRGWNPGRFPGGVGQLGCVTHHVRSAVGGVLCAVGSPLCCGQDRVAWLMGARLPVGLRLAGARYTGPRVVPARPGVMLSGPGVVPAGPRVVPTWTPDMALGPRALPAGGLAGRAGGRGSGMGDPRAERFHPAAAAGRLRQVPEGDCLLGGAAVPRGVGVGIAQAVGGVAGNGRAPCPACLRGSGRALNAGAAMTTCATRCSDAGKRAERQPQQCRRQRRLPRRPPQLRTWREAAPACGHALDVPGAAGRPHRGTRPAPWPSRQARCRPVRPAAQRGARRRAAAPGPHAGVAGPPSGARPARHPRPGERCRWLATGS